MRGDERTTSDLDILIDYDRNRQFTLYDLVRIKRYLSRLVGPKAHVVTREGFPPRSPSSAIEGFSCCILMAQPIDIIAQDILGAIEQAQSFMGDLTFAEYEQDLKTQRAVEVISEASRRIPHKTKMRYRKMPWGDIAGLATFFATTIGVSQTRSFGTLCASARAHEGDARDSGRTPTQSLECGRP